MVGKGVLARKLGEYRRLLALHGQVSGLVASFRERAS